MSAMPGSAPGGGAPTSTGGAPTPTPAPHLADVPRGAAGGRAVRGLRLPATGTAHSAAAHSAAAHSAAAPVPCSLFWTSTGASYSARSCYCSCCMHYYSLTSCFCPRLQLQLQIQVRHELPPAEHLAACRRSGSGSPAGRGSGGGGGGEAGAGGVSASVSCGASTVWSDV